MTLSSSALRVARRTLLRLNVLHNGRSIVVRQRTQGPHWTPSFTLKVGHASNFSTAHTTEVAAGSGQPIPSQPKTTFEDLGLHPPIVSSLRAAFQNVEYPTDVQSQFIPAVLDGKNVFLRDSTGSGKSFGLVLALLNKPRIVTNSGGERKRHITSLVLVPHKDLAYQYLYWIKTMVNTSPGGMEPPPLEAIAQVLVRDNNMHLESGLVQLRESIASSIPPHILIATPQALLDIHKSDSGFLSKHLSSSTLSAVCVDEADYLIETLPRKDPSKSFKKAVDREKKRLARHPGPTKELLNIIYRPRMEWNEAEDDDAGHLPPPCPQLILSSATLRTHLRNYVYEESGWLDRQNVVKIYGTPGKKEASDHLQRGLLHSVLLVSAHGVRNVEGAVVAPISDTTVIEQRSGETSRSSTTELEPPRGFDVETRLKFAQTPSPFNPHVLEAIATAFAVDVPSMALLVLPSSASVSRAVFELAELGINACSLDLHEKRRVRSSPDNPTLLVGTLATTRGVDLPELSHVFVYGLPDAQKRVHGRSVDAYLHIAGRVGRFGRDGKVVTFIEEDSAEEGGKKGEAKKMQRILETIHVRPVKFPVEFDQDKFK
ncbi:hypothetical protein CC1G_13690 [Coprinopsis cinerea okayama7|uniref:ATP-dependent RNA helicase n=1 Tax=Coprinopsis cinerea (strain Okayama-7 / 130 / ATCC MYA-4618 / FGSC 9003) TaxID=240176 RepID=D6RJY5_COPC7|nr:hypothetical protein CC1G_13690 [Coprinopsis cinerea okayama7\|eukprot:XP_002912158.1 hypothetical protein CC1G_13690 [Coprinopsis cinerea okayama7\